MIAIKFCGLTNLADCMAALRAGADWLGFNFYQQSPRSITKAECQRVVAELQPTLKNLARPVHLVGVFVGCGAREVLATLDDCGLELAQLSGEDAAETVWGCQGRAYVAVRTGLKTGAVDQLRSLPRRDEPPAGLVDASALGLFGGTGKLADWDQASALAAEFPVFLAGGLTPENVAEAIRVVRPWGVDAASGIERAPGQKDVEKMNAFVRAIREVYEV